jgi:hypothetical protein
MSNEKDTLEGLRKKVAEARADENDSPLFPASFGPWKKGTRCPSAKHHRFALISDADACTTLKAHEKAPDRFAKNGADYQTYWAEYASAWQSCDKRFQEPYGHGLLWFMGMQECDHLEEWDIEKEY